MWNDQRGITIEKKPMRTIEELEVGDVLDCGDGDRKTVLAVCGKVYCLSTIGNQKAISGWVTLGEIHHNGWTLHQEPEPKKVTICRESCEELLQWASEGRTLKDIAEKLKSMVE